MPPGHVGFLFFLIHTVPVWDFLICIFDSYSVRAILSWGVVNCVGAVTVVLHTNWLRSTWKSDIIRHYSAYSRKGLLVFRVKQRVLT